MSLADAPGQTRSDAVGSSSGAIYGSGFSSDSSIVAGSGSWSAVGSGIAGLVAVDEGGTVVEEYPLESPFRFVSGQVHFGHVNTHTHTFGLVEHKKINKSNSLIKQKLKITRYLE